MSNAISPLGGASSDGIAQVQELGLQGMITLRGDLAGAMGKAAAAAAGVDLPGPGQAQFSGSLGLAWMSPDELLLLCPYSDAASIAAQLGSALKGTHAMVANVSDARAMFAVSGPHARAVLAKLCPVDTARFEAGQFRRTRMAQIPAALWLAEAETFHIVTFRSVAQYAFDVLGVAAATGSEVGAF